MTKEYLESILSEYGVQFTSALADRLLKELSGEYIKKEDAIKAFEKSLLGKYILWDTQEKIKKDMKGRISQLPTYSIPETAKPEEGAELIDRRQIKWYGCDHEGHIKGINCDTADCSKCFYATVEHDEVMSLPVYRIPDSADVENYTVEKLNQILEWGYCFCDTDDNEFCKAIKNAIEIITALELLKAEIRDNANHCECVPDGLCIKVDKVLEIIDKYIEGKDNTMEWIAEETEEMEITGYFCSKCDLPSPSGEKTDFCPNCGRKAAKHEKP